MLPVSTPPNAVAYSTGEIETRDLRPGGLFYRSAWSSADHCLGTVHELVDPVIHSDPAMRFFVENAGAEWVVDQYEMAYPF